jgi:hypothetical protein
MIQPAPEATDLLQPASQPTIEKIGGGDEPKQTDRTHPRPGR